MAALLRILETENILKWLIRDFAVELYKICSTLKMLRRSSIDLEHSSTFDAIFDWLVFFHVLL
jgi:hypothetical protein